MNNHLHGFLKQAITIFLFLGCALSISAQSWVQLNDAPFRDDHTNGFGFEGKAYVFRGSPTNDGTGQANDLWVYTAETDTWEEIGRFPGPARNISIGDDWDGKYYYGFGIGGPTGRLSDLWVFDPVDMSFTELPSCPCVGRSHPSLIAHNDKIFMGAGSTNNGDIDDWWEYDIITQEWSQKPNIPGGRRHHMFHFSSGDYVYVGGGHVNNWNRYDPATEEWTPIDNLPAGRVAGTQFNYGGLGFILAGDDRFHDHVPDFETFMYYNPESMEWDYLPPLPNGSRWAPSSFIIGTEVYFAAGLSTIVSGGDQTMWKFDLGLIDCLAPSGLNAIDIEETEAGLFWTANSNEPADSLKWRKVGDTDWNVVLDPEPVYQLEDLEVCEKYEFEVIKLCDDMKSTSEMFEFTTEGCCLNPDVVVQSITPNSALLEWVTIPAAIEYNVRWKSVEAADWDTATVQAGSYELTGLDGCSEYEFQIESICNVFDVDFSESVVFLTKDCGACLDVEYCSVKESFEAQFVFINKVGVNDYVNISGNNAGYGNFDGAKAEELFIGDSFTLTFEPGFEQGSFAFDLKGWVDLNSNGVFDDDEMIIDQKSINEEIEFEVLIPDTAIPGLTRMRIYYSNEIDPCSPSTSFVFGEAEDYCLILSEMPTSLDDLDEESVSLAVSPNPFQNVFTLNGELSSSVVSNVDVINVAGVTVHSIKNYKVGDEVRLPEELNSGVYFLVIESGDDIQRMRVVKQD